MLLSKAEINTKQNGTFYQQHSHKKYLHKCFQILNIYFWIHGIGLPSKNTSPFKKRFQIALSVILAIIFEGNLIYNLFRRHKCVLDNDMHYKNYFIILNFVALSIAQRYSICSSSKKLFTVFTRSVHLCSNIPGKLDKNIVYEVFLTLIITDVFCVLGLLPLFYAFQSSSVLLNNHEALKHLFFDSHWPNATILLLYWKNTSFCITFYFGIICYTLRETLFRTRMMVKCLDINTECLVAVFNVILDIIKRANEIFGNMILPTFAISLGGVFYQLYNIFFSPVGHHGIHLYRIFCLAWFSLPVILICLLASSVSNSAFILKHFIKKVRINDFKKKPYLNITMNTKLSRFTILDSVVIDKSLIFSVGGILISYGTLIATFQISSKQTL